MTTTQTIGACLVAAALLWLAYELIVAPLMPEPKAILDPGDPLLRRPNFTPDTSADMDQAIANVTDDRALRCPECGVRLDLHELRLDEVPAFITESPRPEFVASLRERVVNEVEAQRAKHEQVTP